MESAAIAGAAPLAPGSEAASRRWQLTLAALIVVVLAVPIRRYVLPSGLPVELEPYRLLAGVAIAAWMLALLADPRVRLRASGLEAPIAALVAAAFASLVANPERVGDVSGEVLKRLGLAAGFLLLTYLIVSVVVSERQVDALCRVLVAGGGVVAGLALAEWRTGTNVFDQVIPLHLESSAAAIRGGSVRAYASAQHPIALSALLVMLIPLALHLGRFSARRRWIWWLLAGLLAVGSMATVSRTSVVMLAAVILSLFVLRPGETVKLVPAIVAFAVAVQLAVPRMTTALVQSFAPEGGILSEQEGLPGVHSSGRLADLAPSIRELGERPLLGEGFGTRVVGAGPGEPGNALLLDNQWLGSMLETGLVGAIALLWFFARFVRRCGREGARDPSARGSLLAALAAAVTAYAVGMLTYDAFSFMQVTLVLFMLVGLGCSLLGGPAVPGRRP
jgi:hypothetical protein